MENTFKLLLSQDEKIECLNEINKRIKKIIHVYEKSQEKNSGYDYKIFVKGILFYVSSSDFLFDGKLVNIIINLNSILLNDFDKRQLKTIVFEILNNIKYLLYREENDKYDL